MKIYNGTPCMPWPGIINASGYGRLSVSGRLILAHRAVYESHRGKIPPGLVIDHLCRNRCCVNPDHMEVVTVKENTLRGMNFSARNARKTHCKRGHPFAGENLRIRRHKGSDERVCRTCEHAQWARARLQRHA